MSFPDFLCIGAQKSATSWLDANLRFHPDLWLPPAKELHYFDRGSLPYVAMLFDSDPTKRYLVPNRFKSALKAIVRRRAHPRACLYAVRWYARFLFLPRSDEWYHSLFAPAQGQIAGEVTPGYARLPEDKVMQIHALMPQVKIIYLLRNPVDRVWSQAAMHFRKYGYLGLDKVKRETVRQFLYQPEPIRNSSYTQTLAIWERYFSINQIFVGFFEQVFQEPHQLLLKLYHFLGVSAHENYIPSNIKESVFANKYLQMPDDFRWEVTDRLYPEIVALHKRFDNQYTKNWLISAKNTLKN